MRTLKRPMFKIGGKAEVGNDGIMSGLVDRKKLQDGTALQKFQSIGDIQEIMPYNMRGAEIKDKYDFDFPINLKSTFIAENPQAQNIETTSEGDIFYTGGEPKFKKDTTYYPGQRDPQGSQDEIVDLTTEQVKKLLQPKVKDSDTSTIGGGDKNTGSNNVTQAEKNAILKARAREFEELLNPGARKRVINNALAAASAEFGKSTGNTMQDIANAITAAAGATGEIDKTKTKAAELAIGESIQKGIAKEKYKPGNYEFLVALKEKDPDTYKELIKTKDTDQDSIISLARNYTGPTAVPKAIGDLYQLKADGANAKDYGGTLPVTLDKKSKTNIPDFNKMEAGKTYYSYTDGNFYKIGEGGQPEVTSKPNYLK
jgi:hypothetical protein